MDGVSLRLFYGFFAPKKSLFCHLRYSMENFVYQDTRHTIYSGDLVKVINGLPPESVSVFAIDCESYTAEQLRNILYSAYNHAADGAHIVLFTEGDAWDILLKNVWNAWYAIQIKGQHPGWRYAVTGIKNGNRKIESENLDVCIEPKSWVMDDFFMFETDPFFEVKGKFLLSPISRFGAALPLIYKTDREIIGIEPDVGKALLVGERLREVMHGK
jgi:hypothetical protein